MELDGSRDWNEYSYHQHWLPTESCLLAVVNSRWSSRRSQSTDDHIIETIIIMNTKSLGRKMGLKMSMRLNLSFDLYK